MIQGREAVAKRSAPRPRRRGQGGPSAANSVRRDARGGPRGVVGFVHVTLRDTRCPPAGRRPAMAHLFRGARVHQVRVVRLHRFSGPIRMLARPFFLRRSRWRVQPVPWTAQHRLAHSMPTLQASRWRT